MRSLKLRPNEQLFVWRRMNKLSQGEAAKRFGLHQTSISKMEKGELGIPQKVLIDFMSSVDPDPRLVPNGLRVAILRRRCRVSIGQVAKDLGIHPHRVADMERGRRAVSDAYLRLVK